MINTFDNIILIRKNFFYEKLNSDYLQVHVDNTERFPVGQANTCLVIVMVFITSCCLVTATLLELLFERLLPLCDRVPVLPVSLTRFCLESSSCRLKYMATSCL